MKIDRQTLRDLDVVAHDGRVGTLLDHLDRTSTRRGREHLRRRLTRPLGSIGEILEVQEALRELIARPGRLNALPADAELRSLERYLDSSFATLPARSLPHEWVAAGWMRSRYPELYVEAMEGGGFVRSFLDRMRRLARELADGPALLARASAAIGDALDAEVIRDLAARAGRSEAWHAVLRADRRAREEGRDALRTLLEEAYELDALGAMARATEELGFTFPRFEEGAAVIELEGLRHPFLRSPVENPARFGPEGRIVFLTGPNMAGKSTYLKACGIAVLLAHTGMGVPARACRLGPLARLVTAVRTEDDLLRGVSYFQAEARRVRGIAEKVAVDRRCLVLVDELFRGTNVRDAADATETVLAGFARASESFFLVASHLTEVGARLERLGGVVLQRFEASLEGGRLEFGYRLGPGLSEQRLGMEVLRREGVLDVLRRLADDEGGGGWTNGTGSPAGRRPPDEPPHLLETTVTDAPMPQPETEITHLPMQPPEPGSSHEP